MTNETLTGVDCTVTECIHHAAGDKCCAHSIKVNGRNSKTSAETECETFKPNCCK